MPVAGFIAVTFALGTEAPVESVTIPVIVPLFPNCPKARLARASNAISGPQSNLKQLCFITVILPQVSPLVWFVLRLDPSSTLPRFEQSLQRCRFVRQASHPTKGKL